MDLSHTITQRDVDTLSSALEYAENEVESLFAHGRNDERTMEEAKRAEVIVSSAREIVTKWKGNTNV